MPLAANALMPRLWLNRLMPLATLALRRLPTVMSVSCADVRAMCWLPARWRLCSVANAMPAAEPMSRCGCCSSGKPDSSSAGLCPAMCWFCW